MMSMRQVVIQRQQHHKRKEHPRGAQEVPHVVRIVEIEHDALLVELPGLGGRFLQGETF